MTPNWYGLIGPLARSGDKMAKDRTLAEEMGEKWPGDGSKLRFSGHSSCFGAICPPFPRQIHFFGHFVPCSLYQVNDNEIATLVAPYRTIAYRCNTPYRAIQQAQHSPKKLRYPLLYFRLRRHISAIPKSATYHTILMQYPRKSSSKTFCYTIAESIAI